MRVSCRISVPEGQIELNDGERHRLADGTAGARSVQWRRTTVTSPYVNGTFVASAVQDNVQEQVGVYVYGVDNNDLRRLLRDVTEAFSQFEYTLTWELDSDAFAWRCTVADYQVDTRREFQHATMALATFDVSRLPTIIDL